MRRGRGAVLADRHPAAGRLCTTALLLVLGAAGPLAYAVAQPAYSTGDEMAHVDYAYQLWHGRFPDFFAGLALDPGVGFRPPVQWTSQHPPLFYALLSPVVGPFVDAGRPVVAVMLARGLLVAMAAVSVLVVRWSARGAFPSVPALGTVAALVYALSSWFPRQGGSIYNDLPAVLAVTLAFGFLVRALRVPDDRRLVLGLAAALAAASLVRFSALPLAVGLVAALLTHRVLVLRRLRQALLEVLAVAVAVVLAAGWWWARSWAETGTVQGSRAEYWIAEHGWTRRSLTEAASPEFWHTMLQQFFSTTFLRPIETWERPATVGIVALLLAPLLLGLLVIGRDLWRGRRAPGAGADVVVALTLVGLVGTVVVTQIHYGMTSGSFLPRYFFALVPAAATIMAYGFVRHRWTLVPFVAWVAVRLVAMAVEVASTLARPLRGPQADLYPDVAWTAAGIAAATAGALTVLVVRSRTRGRGAAQASGASAGSAAVT